MSDICHPATANPHVLDAVLPRSATRSPRRVEHSLDALLFPATATAIEFQTGALDPTRLHASSVEPHLHQATSPHLISLSNSIVPVDNDAPIEWPSCPPRLQCGREGNTMANPRRDGDDVGGTDLTYACLPTRDKRALRKSNHCHADSPLRCGSSAGGRNGTGDGVCC